MKKCPYCSAEYLEGESVDIGVGFQQVTPDEPSCDCEYITWMEEQEKGDSN